MCRGQVTFIWVFFRKFLGSLNSFGMGIGHFEKEDWLRRCLLTLWVWVHVTFETWCPVLSCDFETCVEPHPFQYLPSVLHWEEWADLLLYVLSCLGMFEYSKTCPFEAGDTWSTCCFVFIKFLFFYPPFSQFLFFSSTSVCFIWKQAN